MPPLPRIDAQLLGRADRPPAGDAWLHELKHDGHRAIAYLDGRVTLRSKIDRDSTARFPAIAAALSRIRCRSAIIDGEIACPDEAGVTVLHQLEAALTSGRHQACVLYAFDLLWLDGRDLRDLPLTERKAKLAQLLAGAPPRIQLVEHMVGRGPELFDAACAAGAEGVVSKRATSRYVGGRSTSWLKSKRRDVASLDVVGFAGADRLDALLVGDAGGVLGRIEYGLALARRHRALPALRSLAHAERDGVTWVRPGLVADVHYFGRTREGRLRFPVLRGLRVGQATNTP